MCTCVLVNLCICPQPQWLHDWSEIWVKARSSRFRVLFGNFEKGQFSAISSSKRHIVSIFYPSSVLKAQSLCHRRCYLEGMKIAS